MIGVIKINDNAPFETNGGVSLGINQVYLSLQPILPESGIDRGLLKAAKGTVKFRIFTNNTFTSELKDVKYLKQFNDLELSNMIAESFWDDINAGNTYDEVIKALEERNPFWVGKITKEIIT